MVGKMAVNGFLGRGITYYMYQFSDILVYIMSSTKHSQWKIWHSVGAVSYTHLTLPTRRTV